MLIFRHEPDENEEEFVLLLRNELKRVNSTPQHERSIRSSTKGPRIHSDRLCYFP